MTGQELVKAAIAHRETDRVPYCIGYTPDGKKELQRLIGADQDADEYTDNDVIRIGPPWWQWHDLAADWRQMPTPTTAPTVRGRGRYEQLS